MPVHLVALGKAGLGEVCTILPRYAVTSATLLIMR